MPHELLLIFMIPVIVVLAVLRVVLWQVRKQRRFTNRLGEALGAVRSKGQMNGTHDGIAYHFRWNPGSRNTPSYLRVFLDCSSAGRFRVVREGALEPFFVRLGIASPIRTGDSAFDKEFYIFTNDTDFASGYFHDPQKRQAVMEIFRMGFTEVKHDGKVMEARMYVQVDLHTRMIYYIRNHDTASRRQARVSVRYLVYFSTNITPQRGAA